MHGGVLHMIRPIKIHHGDALTVLRTLPAESIHCCVTSPPYWGLRDYGVAGQLGLERTPEEYITRMVEVFREVRRVLRADGTCWVNIGDSYAGSWGAQGRQGDGAIKGRSACYERQIAAAAKKASRIGSIPESSVLKPKDLVGIPWMLAFALRADGWYLRSEIIWHKPNPMPESVQDRPTKAHEQIFLLSKSERYWYDADAIAEQSQCREFRRPHGWADDGDHSAVDWSAKRTSVVRGGFTGKTEAMASQGRNSFRAVVETRNKRTVWTVATQPTPEAHFATYPIALIEPCVLAGCPAGGTVLDPFCGAGTTGMAAMKHGRDFIGIELNAEYIAIAEKRLMDKMPLLASAQ